MKSQGLLNDELEFISPNGTLCRWDLKFTYERERISIDSGVFSRLIADYERLYKLKMRLLRRIEHHKFKSDNKLTLSYHKEVKRQLNELSETVVGPSQVSTEYLAYNSMGKFWVHGEWTPQSSCGVCTNEFRIVEEQTTLENVVSISKRWKEVK